MMDYISELFREQNIKAFLSTLPIFHIIPTSKHPLPCVCMHMCWVCVCGERNGWILAHCLEAEIAHPIYSVWESVWLYRNTFFLLLSPHRDKERSYSSTNTFSHWFGCLKKTHFCVSLAPSVLLCPTLACEFVPWKLLWPLFILHLWFAWLSYRVKSLIAKV